MAVNLSKPDAASLHPVAGVTLGTAMAGVRKANRRDVTVVLLEPGAAVAASSPPTDSAPRRCRSAASTSPRAPRCARSSSTRATPTPAPARTGSRARARRARRSRRGSAALPAQVLPFSTGVIMETLPNDRIEAGLPAAIADARADGWSTAAEAIMTTDTVPKAASTTLTIGGRRSR
jgi:glutamate N-acetyltransferase/amino-acid N-acetyltransferase